MKTLLSLLILCFLSNFTFSQSESEKKIINVTKTDGKNISGVLINQSSETLTLEVDGMTVSIPTNLINSVSYQQKSKLENSNVNRIKTGLEILKAVRPIVVANQTGVSLVNFAPMLVTARTDVIVPLREFEKEDKFTITINKSLSAYQDALEAWQNKLKTDFVASSSDYGKWAVSTYNVERKGLFKVVWLEDVRVSALLKAEYYFRQAEIIIKELQHGKTSEEGSETSYKLSNLQGNWLGEITILADNKNQTFTLFVDSSLSQGKFYGFGSSTSIIKSITSTPDNKVILITGVKEKIQKADYYPLFYLKFESKDKMSGNVRLEKVKDGTITDIIATVQFSRVVE